MKITYVTHTRFPVHRAHGKQIAHVCSSVASLGHDVTLLRPTMTCGVDQDPYTYFGVPNNFDVVTVEHFNASKAWWIPGMLNFLMTMKLYRRALRAFTKNIQTDLYYCRSPEVVDPLVETNVPVVLELHTVPRRGVGRFVQRCNACAKVVCLTSPMRDAVVSLGVDEERVIVEGDAVDLRCYEKNIDAQEAKMQFGLPTDKPVIGYVGSFVTHGELEKGVGDCIQLFARILEHAHGFIVGGPPKWRKKYEALAEELNCSKHITFQDQIPSSQVPTALAACDVLIYPAPKSDHPYFQRDTSPLKLFEYLAAGKPIVCAELPPVRDIVSQETVAFYHPGDLESMQSAVEGVLANSDESAQKARKGMDLVQNHSWEKRMERILGDID